MDVHVYTPNLATICGTSPEKGKDKNGKEFSRSYAWVDTWMERNGKWECIAEAVMQFPEVTGGRGYTLLGRILPCQTHGVSRQLEVRSKCWSNKIYSCLIFEDEHRSIISLDMQKLELECRR